MHQPQKALNKDQTFKLLNTLQELEKGMSGAIEEAVCKEAYYLKNHQNRLGYADTDKKGEPIGSGSFAPCFRHITNVNSKGLVNFRFRKETKHYLHYLRSDLTVSNKKVTLPGNSQTQNRIHPSKNGFKPE